MKKLIVSFMVCTMFFWAKAGFQLTGATQKFATKTLAMTQMRALATQFAEVRKSTKGLALANASQISGEMVAMVIDSGSKVLVEFISNGLMNMGTTSWPDVRVVATIEVTAMSPYSGLEVGAGCEVMGSEIAYAGLQGVNSVQTVTVVSAPFSIEPNKEYRGTIQLVLPAPNDDGRWVRAKVKSIKFKL